MIRVKHPLEKCNMEQEAMLRNFSGEQQRYHELMFCYGNACYRYYEHAPDFSPTEIDFKEWLEGLQENLRRDMLKKGLEGSKGDLSFRRYVLEKNDMGMKEYITGLMGVDEYRAYERIVLNLKRGMRM